MVLEIVGWFFLLTTYGFLGANPPTVVGPFASFEQCVEISRGVKNTNASVSQCWSGPVAVKEKK